MNGGKKKKKKKPRKVKFLKKSSSKLKGTAVAQSLRRCATNLKVAGSIAGGVIGIMH